MIIHVINERKPIELPRGDVLCAGGHRPNSLHGYTLASGSEDDPYDQISLSAERLLNCGTELRHWQSAYDRAPIDEEGGCGTHAHLSSLLGVGLHAIHRLVVF